MEQLREILSRTVAIHVVLSYDGLDARSSDVRHVILRDLERSPSIQHGLLRF